MNEEYRMFYKVIGDALLAFLLTWSVLWFVASFRTLTETYLKQVPFECVPELVGRRKLLLHKVSI